MQFDNLKQSHNKKYNGNYFPVPFLSDALDYSVKKACVTLVTNYKENMS